MIVLPGRAKLGSGAEERVAGLMLFTLMLCMRSCASAADSISLHHVPRKTATATGARVGP